MDDSGADAAASVVSLVCEALLTVSSGDSLLGILRCSLCFCAEERDGESRFWSSRLLRGGDGEDVESPLFLGFRCLSEEPDLERDRLSSRLRLSPLCTFLWPRAGEDLRLSPRSSSSDGELARSSRPRRRRASTLWSRSLFRPIFF